MVVWIDKIVAYACLSNPILVKYPWFDSLVAKHEAINTRTLYTLVILNILSGSGSVVLLLQIQSPCTD